MNLSNILLWRLDFCGPSLQEVKFLIRITAGFSKKGQEFRYVHKMHDLEFLLN